ncbi:response regulator transcription factor [Parapedobacter deserti]|uniref:Response regulator transcription factor n=1 Tax=Parapedobacter deserti TaxID=1912957 RepID=A0ABV7JUF5_9SPHI
MHASALNEDTHKRIRQKYNLTKREVEIMRQVRQNKTTLEIAEQLFVSPLTIETHRRDIRTKLNIKGNNGLLLFAQRHLDI